MADTDVVVLGAGPAGLQAALTARRRGLDVVVLEAADRVGGLAASIDIGGCRVDLGSHRLHPSIHPALLGELESLGVDLQRRARNGRIRFGDRWVAFPLRMADLSRSLPRSFVAGAVLDVAVRPARRRRPVASFADAVASGVGATLAEEFYEPYAQKLWGLPGAELSPLLAQRRVSAQGPVDLLRRAIAPDGRGRWFRYPAAGFGAISDGLRRGAESAGAEVRCGHRVEAVLPGTEPVVAVAGGKVTARQVLSTLPLPSLATLVAAAPPAVRTAALGLDYRAMVLVYLVVDRPQYTPYDAHYFPGPDVAPARLSEPKNYRDSSDDPRDRTVLCAELPCDEGDATWSASAAQLAERVCRDLAGCGLPDPDPVAVEIRRLPRVYPVYRRGFERAYDEVTDWALGLDGLVSFGRPGLFVADNTHHALAMGRAAGECLRRDGTFDRSRWQRALAGFADHVVED